MSSQMTWKRMTDILPCSVCKETKPKEDFHNRAVCTQRGGKDSQCKACKSLARRDYFLRHREKEQIRGREKAWKSMGVEMNYFAYAQLVSDVDGRCEICGDSKGLSLHVDHCHTSSQYRGLLCGPCNKGLGQFKDNPMVLKAAISYLERTNG